MKKVLEYIAVFIILASLAAFGGYRYYLLSDTYQLQLARSAEQQYQLAELNEKIAAANSLNDDLQKLLQARQQEKDAIGQQVQTLSSTVSELDKLNKTDKQLLEKYSSIYFLNENYIPQSLTMISTSSLARPKKPEQFLSGVYSHLTALLDAAKAANVPLNILSAYRSFGAQEALKTNYNMTYGAGTANSFSADQGYSEHQLGTAVDFSTPTLKTDLTNFDKSTAYPWLAAHAYEYGFILSYPKGNTHFVFEPWHWRYVGIELAKKLHDEGKSFYDLDQRDINTYIVKFFD